MYQDNANHVASEAPEMADESADAGLTAEPMGVDDEAPDAAMSALAEAQAGDGHAGRGALTASFLAEISRAMRATAIQERERISSTVADTTVAHEQKVRERGASEATELRRMADDDVERIETTAAAEIQRIKDDAERQVGDRRNELTDHLERHTALIETEIGRIRGAVDDYDAELDGFFGRLAEEQNPAEIARLAGLLPEPPDLDQVGSIARADAVGLIADEATAAEAVEAAEAAQAAEALEAEGAALAEGEMPAAEVPVGDAGSTAAEDEAGASSDAEQTLVGVMDPEAGTPVMDESAEPADLEAVPAGAIAEDEGAEATDASADAASAGGISAARLLRSLAPWTSPDRPPDENPD